MYIVENIAEQRGREKAHAQAFQQTLDYIEEKVILNFDILPLVDICSYYKERLGETDYPNPNYRVENLKVL